MRGREVVEGHDRREPELKTPVDHCLVVVEGLLGELPLDRLDPSPLHGESVGRESHPRRQSEVFAPELVAVARLPGPIAEDGRRHVLGEPRVAVDVVALVLVAGAGHAPEEPEREASSRHAVLLS